VPKPSDCQSASETAWQLARQREAVIRPLAEDPCTRHADVDAAAGRLGLCRSYVYRLLARYRCRPQTSSLLSAQQRGRPEGTRLVDEQREALIKSAIQDFYLQQERPRITDLMRDIQQRCHQLNVKPPHRRTVHKRVLEIDAKRRTQLRLGTKSANAQFRPVRSSPFQDLRPLDLVQVDHTLLDVTVVDEQERLSIGRPWLTLAVDVATRVVTGFSVSLDGPSTVSVALVLTHAVMPKEMWLADLGLEGEWPVSGIPRRLHLDNAKEFQSAALLRACQEYGMELEYRPRGAPHYGGHIERLIGSTMGAVHFLPGTTFSNPIERGGYDSEAKAALTLLELQRWLVLQIAGVYHRTIHSTLGRPPIDLWKESVYRLDQPLRKPTNGDEFFIQLLPGEYRTLQRDGIRLFNIRYWDNVLSTMVGRSQDPCLIKYDPRNLSRIYLEDREGSFWPIPYSDLSRPPVSLWELRQAQHRLREHGRRALDEASIFEAIREQRHIIEQAKKTSRARRKREKLAGLTRAERMNPEQAGTSEPEELKSFEVEEWY
jgi:putative transposase